ncbi:MAG: CUB domain-containing protein, partial [Sediminibacterium sp.]
MNKFLSLLFFSLFSLYAHSQITAIYTGTLSTCGGTLADDGLGGPYTDNNYTLVLCPSNPGDVIQLDFSAFQLQTSPNGNNSDYLSIHDGPNASSPPLGSYTGNVVGLSGNPTPNNKVLEGDYLPYEGAKINKSHNSSYYLDRHAIGRRESDCLLNYESVVGISTIFYNFTINLYLI